MRIKQSFKFIIILTFAIMNIVALNSCSKDDSDPTADPIEQNGGEIFRSQVVTVNLSGIQLSENEYEGTLGGAPITLMSSEEGKLLFLVPFSSVIGVQDLVIPTLNATVHYDVKNTQLTETPDAVLAPFFSNLDTFESTLDASAEAVNVQNSINSFNNIYNNATAEQKEQLAIMYKANKESFDNILLNDYSDVTGKNITPSDIIMLAKHSHAVWVMAGGALVALYAPEPIEKAFGITVAAIGAKKALQFYNEFKDENLNTINVSADEILGSLNRNTNNTEISLESDVTKTITFKIKERKLITSDATKTQPQVVSFFKAHNKYNFIVTKANAVIQWVNANLPFADFSTISSQSLPNSAPEADANVTSEIFNKIQFSLNHPNLQLVSKSLQGDGQLNIKIKVIGNPTTLPVESFLSFSYTDEFSSFSGKFPIKVNSNPLIGTWTMVTFKNGTAVGSYTYTYNQNCPSIWDYKESESGSFTFTDNTFSYSWLNTIVMPNLSYNPSTCQVYSDGPDTTDQDNETGGGTYAFNGTQYILTYNGGTDTDVVQFITPDRIKIYDQEFVRQ